MRIAYCILFFSLVTGAFGIAGMDEVPGWVSVFGSYFGELGVFRGRDGMSAGGPFGVRREFLVVDLDGAEKFERMGTNFLNGKKYEEAIESFDRAIELYPGSFQSHWGRGVARFFLSQSELAIKNLDRAIELNPEKPEAYWFRGLAMRLLGRYGWEQEMRKAVDMFREQGTIGNVSDLEKTIESFKKESTSP